MPFRSGKQVKFLLDCSQPLYLRTPREEKSERSEREACRGGISKRARRIFITVPTHGIRVENTGSRRKPQHVEHTESACKTWGPGAKYGV